MMTYDYELTLLSYETEQDEIGQEVKIKPIERKILCGIKSIVRNEFYAAAQTGLKPEITFIVHNFEYNGEKEVEFEGQKYRVIRTYLASSEEIELVCEKVF